MSRRYPDDTALDSIAAQVRSLRPLASGALASLLAEARSSSAGAARAALVEQQLPTVLDAVLARRTTGVELLDLYQEGSVAATVAVAEYVGRSGGPDGLRPYVARVVDRFLDEVVEREAAQRKADELLLERVRLLEAAEVALKRRLERAATVLELASALEWTPAEVETVAEVLHRAQLEHDATIVEYLDDLDGDLPRD